VKRRSRRRGCPFTGSELAERFEITELPTLVVVDGTAAQVRLEAPRDRASIEAALSPWLL
jgi:hypothetical protein